MQSPVTLIETRHGKFMVLSNENSSYNLAVDKDYEPHFYQLAARIVKPGDCVIDCGANLGYHAITLSKLVGKYGQVIAAEPLRLIYYQLAGNIFLNGLKNITAYNVALGNENKFIEMNPIDINKPTTVPEESIAATTIGKGGDKVKMMKIDDLIQIKNKISFIKIDVQGSELMVLEGSEQVLQASRPVLFIEIENPWLEKFNTTAEALMNKLLSLGYTLLQVKNEYPCDHLAIPVEKEHLIKDYTLTLNVPYRVIKGKSVQLTYGKYPWIYEDINVIT